jgi:hypothetical protein
VNLQLYFRVLLRHKIVVGVGLVLALGLAFLSYAKVDFKHPGKVTYRSEQVYQAEATLLVSEPGFPWGRANPTVGTGTKSDPAGAVASQTRLTSIAVLYAQLANSDPVRRLLQKSGPPILPKDITAAPVVQAYSSVGPLLPLVSITGRAPSKAIATSYARRETDAFLRYLTDKQDHAKIPPDQRVVVQVLDDGSAARVIQGRKKTLTLLVFITVMLAVSGLAFMLENLRNAAAAAAEEEASARATPRVLRGGRPSEHEVLAAVARTDDER